MRNAMAHQQDKIGFWRLLLIVAGWVIIVAAIANSADAQVVPVRSAMRSDQTWGAGTGITIYSGGGRSLHITCAHVVDTGTGSVNGYPGRVVARDASLDIVLIECAHECPYVATLGDDLGAGDSVDVAAYPDGFKGGMKSASGRAVTSSKADYLSGNGWSGGPVGRKRILQAMHLGRIGEGREHARLLPVSEIKTFLTANIKTDEGCVGFT